jgi:hypothetical protein
MLIRLNKVGLTYPNDMAIVGLAAFQGREKMLCAGL